MPSFYNRHDFLVPYQEDHSLMAQDIFDRLFFVNRLQANKPTILLMTGESGDGKTTTAANILDNHYRKKGIKLEDILPYIIVFNPGQFYDAINLLLSPPKDHPKYELLKKADTLWIDEAGEVVSSDHWQSTVNENIRRINAISRGVKPLFIIWITPFIGDIELKTRKTANFHGICTRETNHPARLELRRVLKNERDFEKPKIEPKAIRGYIQMPDGQIILDYPKFEFSMPRKEIMELYDKLEKENKTNLIQNKLAKLADWFSKEAHGQLDRVEAIVSHYTQSVDEMYKVAEKKKGAWKVKPEVQYMFNLNREEVSTMQKRLNEELNKKGVIADAVSITTTQ